MTNRKQILALYKKNIPATLDDLTWGKKEDRFEREKKKMQKKMKTQKSRNKINKK